MEGRSIYSKNEINDVITESNFEINSMLETANPKVIASKFNSLDTLYAIFFFSVKKEFEQSKILYDKCSASVFLEKLYS